MAKAVFISGGELYRSKADTMATWPYLRSFLSSNLHQDADIVGGNDTDDRTFFGNIVADYCKSVEAESRRAVLADIDAIIAQGRDVSDEFLEGLGMEYSTGALTSDGFITLLRDLFNKHLDDPRAPPLPYDPSADAWTPMRRRMRSSKVRCARLRFLIGSHGGTRKFLLRSGQSEISHNVSFPVERAIKQARGNRQRAKQVGLHHQRGSRRSLFSLMGDGYQIVSPHSVQPAVSEIAVQASSCGVRSALCR